MSKDKIHLANTHYGYQEEPGKQKPEQSIKPDKSENQQTDLNVCDLMQNYILLYEYVLIKEKTFFKQNLYC